MSVEDFYRKGFDNRNALNMYALFILFLASVTFLFAQGIDTGTIYFGIIIGSFVGMQFVFQFYKKDSSITNIIAGYIRVPFAFSSKVSSRWLLAGLFIPFVVFVLVSSLFPAFSIESVSTPLFGNRLFDSFQTFSASKILSSGAWQSATTSFGAGVGETLAFSYFLVVAFIPLAIWFIGFFVSDPYKVNKNIIILMAIFFVSLTFMGIHVLNNTYQGVQFLIAFLFLFFSTLSIYYFGVLLIFWVGFHISWNQVILIKLNGWSWFFSEVLFSWYGVFIAGLVLLLSYQAFALPSKRSFG